MGHKMKNILCLPAETLVMIFSVVQEQSLRDVMSSRKYPKKHSCPVVSREFLALRACCRAFFTYCKNLPICVVVRGVPRLTTCILGLKTRMTFTKGGIRPFALPRMKYTFVSDSTQDLACLQKPSVQSVRLLFDEIYIHQKLYLSMSFVLSGCDFLRTAKVTMCECEITPKNLLYPFALPEDGTVHRESAIISARLRTGNFVNRRCRLTVGTTWFLMGRTRVWKERRTGKDILPSHIPKSKTYIVSEGAHSKKDSPCFTKSGFTLLVPEKNAFMSRTFIKVSAIETVHLTYVDIGCVETFLCYFSGLKNIVLRERVLGRARLSSEIGRLCPHIKITEVVRHV